MSTYVLSAGPVSIQSPKLIKGVIRISATVPVYWIIGENPVASPVGCAKLSASNSIELRLPVKCSRLAVTAIATPGIVTIIELGHTRPSCSL